MMTTDENEIQIRFSMRKFLISYILMSHSTVHEKLDLLYDIFDWVDGTADGIKPQTLFLMLETIFERSLYFWPSHELYNMVELIVTGHSSMCYKAYWTRDVKSI